jgi:acyl-CoA thioesterase I
MTSRLPLCLGVGGLLALTMGLIGCGSSSSAPPSQAEGQVVVEPGQIAESRKSVIAFLGDSLTAGLGLTEAQSFPAQIQSLFRGEGYAEVEVLNAGVSGDTTAGGQRRVESVLATNVRILVVALGGNDALRGLSASQTRENLVSILDTALARGVRVLLAGMEAPTNLGDDYRTGFRATFAGLARDYRGRISYVPFLLEGVAANPELNQADGIHPNERGAKIIAEHLYPLLRDMVDQLPSPGM